MKINKQYESDLSVEAFMRSQPCGSNSLERLSLSRLNEVNRIFVANGAKVSYNSEYFSYRLLGAKKIN